MFTQIEKQIAQQNIEKGFVFFTGFCNKDSSGNVAHTFIATKHKTHCAAAVSSSKNGMQIFNFSDFI
jgi:hypothetical protein